MAEELSMSQCPKKSKGKVWKQEQNEQLSEAAHTLGLED